MVGPGAGRDPARGDRPAQVERAGVVEKEVVREVPVEVVREVRALLPLVRAFDRPFDRFWYLLFDR